MRRVFALLALALVRSTSGDAEVSVEPLGAAGGPRTEYGRHGSGEAIALVGGGTVRGAALYPGGEEGEDDVSLYFDLRALADDGGGGGGRVAVSWRHRTKRREKPRVGGPVRLDEPFTVTTRLGHEVLVRRWDDGRILAHVARAPRPPKVTEF